MSITAAIVARYDDHVDSDATAMRAELGTDKLWVDKAPEEVGLPYATVTHISSSQESERKSQDARWEEAIIQIDVWSEKKSKVEVVMDKFEDAYIGYRMTISNRRHLATYFDNRLVMQDKINLWHGVLQLRVNVEKS